MFIRASVISLFNYISIHLGYLIAKTYFWKRSDAFNPEFKVIKQIIHPL